MKTEQEIKKMIDSIKFSEDMSQFSNRKEWEDNEKLHNNTITALREFGSKDLKLYYKKIKKEKMN